MTEHKIASVDGTAEIDVHQTAATAALPSGAYGLMITVNAPVTERLQAIVDRDGFAELLTGILADDAPLREAVRQALFKRGMTLQDLPGGQDPLTS